jgi:dTDP-4-amino-4,6-dideoxygalactose transaminase
MKINYVNLAQQWAEDKIGLLKIIDQTLSTGKFVGGEQVDIFEKNIAKICGCKYAVGLNSGTDALTLALHLAGVRRGDEVITTPNSFIASTSVIVHLGARPVFIDVLPDQNINYNLIKKKITKKTKVIMPVHLTGRLCEMDPIMKLANKFGIAVIEDAAQAIGSKYNNKKAGSFGFAGCFSAHPLKNLNAMGDAGYLTTNNYNVYKKIKDISNHGMTNRNIVKNFGYVSRLDNIQAAILNYRLKKLDKIIFLRRRNASLYKSLIKTENVFIPEEKRNQFNTYHTFVVQIYNNREKLISFLKKNGIGTSIHYPIPIHLQPAAKFLGYKKNDFPETEKQSKQILSLPIHHQLKLKEIEYISKKINEFFH